LASGCVFLMQAARGPGAFPHQLVKETGRKSRRTNRIPAARLQKIRILEPPTNGLGNLY